ncbi:MAG: ribose 5-phosphate isomerase B [Brevinema sp.]
MKIALGTDHGGFDLKEQVKNWLLEHGHSVEDFGTNDGLKSVDYIDYVYPASVAVADKKADRAIVFCGTGLGASYVANKVHGIRAALCDNEFCARLSREHNDANVLVLGGRVLTAERAMPIVKLWLETEFEGGRHQARIDKILEIEKTEMTKNI